VLFQMSEHWMDCQLFQGAAERW